MNIEKAIEWAIKAIEQGNATAAYNLGTVYRDLLEFEKAVSIRATPSGLPPIPVLIL